MACLNLSIGDFVDLDWSNAPSTDVGDVKVTRAAGSISIEKEDFPAPLNLNGDFRYAVFGATGFIALLRIDDGAATSTRTVFIVDITGASLTTIQVHLQNQVPTGHALPALSRSPGSATLTFVWSSTGNVSEVNTLSIVRSDTGDPVLVALGPKPGINNTIVAEVTASELIIHHPNTFGPDTTAGPRPAGSLTVVPASQDFGEAVLGASDASLATITRTFTLRNDGDDCITVAAIANNAPFSLTAASAALLSVELDPGEEQDIDVRFAPAAPGSFTRALAITRTPANGASSLTCEGEARQAEARITTSTNAVNFGTIPHPGTDTRDFTVSNTGELDVAITIPAAPAGSDFSWTAVAGQALPVSGAPFPVTVTFTTPGDLAAPQRTITITPTQGDARQITVNGAGCIPNAAIDVPPISPLDFGQIERGFRTVRFREITNTGDADLAFRARITPAADPAHAARFGLVVPDNDITDAPPERHYSVLPAVRCGAGPTGPDTAAVAVSFFADGASGSYSANLVIDQHNADNVPAGQSWTFPLSAEIIDPVPVDAVLVLDHSGSMGDQIGARNKMEAALAAGRLFVQMLRDSADDRAAIVGFETSPNLVQTILPIAGNRATFESAIAPANFNPAGATNLAGGVIVGKDELTPHPANPPLLKKAMIVLTDGIENRCFQDGGSTFFSITGRDSNDPPEGMRRPDGTPQDTEPLPAPAGVNVYGIGLGNPAQTDGAALDALSSATGASYRDVVELTGSDFFLLEKYFTEIFMATAGVAQIADPFFTINPGDQHELEFDIFPGDVNAMVVLYDEPGRRLPFFIASPSGEVLSGTSLPAGFAVRFHSTDTARFADFHFPNGEPERYAGRWKVVIRHEGRVCEGEISHRDDRQGRTGYVGTGFLPEKCRQFNQPVNYGIAIGAGSNLRMQAFVEPGVKLVGDPIRLVADIAEAGLPVTGATVTVRAETPFGQTYQLTLHDDGLSQDGQAGDGSYGGVFLNTLSAGVYRFFFRSQGTQPGKVPITWVREAERTKAVHDKRRSPVVGNPEEGERPAGGGGTLGTTGCCKRLIRLLEAQNRLLGSILDTAGNRDAAGG
jgi:hypothetical protein